MAYPSRLRAKLFELTNEFTAGVLDAIAATSLDEILAPSDGAAPVKTKPVARRVSRGRRRSAEDFDATIDAIVSTLQKHGGALRAEELRARLGLDRRDMHGPIAKALASKRIRKTGEKRTTTYFVR